MSRAAVSPSPNLCQPPARKKKMMREHSRAARPCGRVLMCGSRVSTAHPACRLSAVIHSSSGVCCAKSSRKATIRCWPSNKTFNDRAIRGARLLPSKSFKLRLVRCLAMLVPVKPAGNRLARNLATLCWEARRRSNASKIDELHGLRSAICAAPQCIIGWCCVHSPTRFHTPV